MPEAESDQSYWLLLFQEGWVPLLIMGVFMLGLRLFNVHQREQQRKLLREGLISEMIYKDVLRRRRHQE